ncbi:POU domain, class 3, transcription factor 3-B isoform X1 [Lates japonicus]|uniref:POU domain, class 3, transcription factor 3-B isoform X1 n=1 Tax=Lates japonicus TaxID=270547 RepID=A0AAD3NNK1_LATJO|nr:POU domain, class 3, transcription factor 3-B isoform X1 [Lates japonicus]
MDGVPAQSLAHLGLVMGHRSDHGSHHHHPHHQHPRRPPAPRRQHDLHLDDRTLTSDDLNSLAGQSKRGGSTGLRRRTPPTSIDKIKAQGGRAAHVHHEAMGFLETLPKCPSPRPREISTLADNLQLEKEASVMVTETEGKRMTPQEWHRRRRMCTPGRQLRFSAASKKFPCQKAGQRFKKDSLTFVETRRLQPPNEPVPTIAVYVGSGNHRTGERDSEVANQSPRRWRISTADGSMVGDRDRGRPVLRGPPVTSPAAARRPAASSGQPSQQASLSGSSYQGDSMSAQPRSAAEGGRVRRRGASGEPNASPGYKSLPIPFLPKVLMPARLEESNLRSFRNKGRRY